MDIGYWIIILDAGYVATLLCPASCILRSLAAYIWIFGTIIGPTVLQKDIGATAVNDVYQINEFGRGDWGRWAFVGASRIMDNQHGVTDVGPLVAGPLSRCIIPGTIHFVCPCIIWHTESILLREL